MLETSYTKQILLGDDEKDITNLIEEVLHKDGFKNIKEYCKCWLCIYRLRLIVLVHSVKT
jgi:hypothetical protein